MKLLEGKNFEDPFILEVTKKEAQEMGFDKPGKITHRVIEQPEGLLWRFVGSIVSKFPDPDMELRIV